MYSLGGYSRMRHSVSRRLVINVLVGLAPIFDKMLLQIVSTVFQKKVHPFAFRNN